ncbi:MAG: GntR family transcriptional regulator [Betaproteobacteria bacterium]
MPRSGSTADRRDFPASVPDKVVDAVNEGILRRRFSAGQRLVEADLVQELGVSRGTVREALKKLSAAGVVRLEPHRGAFIRSLTRGDAAQLLLVLEALCGLAARLAAGAMDDAGHRRRFARTAEAILSFESNPEGAAFLTERARFYQTMLEIAGNRELERVMPLPHIHLFRTQFHGMLSHRDLRETIREYQEICEAILAGNARLAEQRMCRHIRRTGERIQRLPDSAFARDD